MRKVREYASLGIPQYWIVEHSPDLKVQILILGENGYLRGASAVAGTELAAGIEADKPFSVSFDLRRCSPSDVSSPPSRSTCTIIPSRRHGGGGTRLNGARPRQRKPARARTSLVWMRTSSGAGSLTSSAAPEPRDGCWRSLASRRASALRRRHLARRCRTRSG